MDTTQAQATTTNPAQNIARTFQVCIQTSSIDLLSRRTPSGSVMADRKKPHEI
jgi:hypothetical protein